jgi:hypothetical protein
MPEVPVSGKYRFGSRPEALAADLHHDVGVRLKVEQPVRRLVATEIGRDYQVTVAALTQVREHCSPRVARAPAGGLEN